MNKKNLLIAVTAPTIIIMVFALVTTKNEERNLEAPLAQKFEAGLNEDADIIYFYGNECSSCKEVTEFLEKEKIAERVVYSKKEAWHNKGNAEEFKSKYMECGIEDEDLAWPFLYARGKCVIGSKDIIDFFKKEAELESE